MATESNTYNDYSVAATEAEPLISNFSFWLKPQVGNKLFDVNPVETDFGDFMKMGLMRQTNGPETIHHEANSRFDVPIVNTSATQANVYGTASVGNGDPASEDGLAYIQLATASHSPSSGPNQYTKSYPRKGQHILFKNGGEWRIHGKRTSVAGAHRLYLQQVQASMPNLAATITNAGGQYGGDIFIVPTTSYGEASLGQTEGMVPTSKSHISYLQTFSDFYKVTDQQLENETYPLEFRNPVTGASQTINFTYVKGINDTEIRMAAAIDNGLFLTSKDDGNLTDLDPETDEEADVTTTQGYIPALELSAQELLYDTTPTIALFDQIGRLRRKLQQGDQCMMHMGYEVRTALESVATQLGVNGGMVYDRKAVDLNVQQITKGGFVYNMKDMKALNHSKFGGAAGFKYPNYFIIAPTMKEKDAKDGKMLDPVNILYMKPHGEGTRGHYKIWETGGFAHGKPATDGRAVRKIHMYCRMGTQTVAATKHILGKPVTLS